MWMCTVILMPQRAVMCVNKIYEFSLYMPDSLYRSSDIHCHVEIKYTNLADVFQTVYTGHRTFTVMLNAVVKFAIARFVTHGIQI